jgi:hypothetical protein
MREAGGIFLHKKHPARTKTRIPAALPGVASRRPPATALADVS